MEPSFPLAGGGRGELLALDPVLLEIEVMRTQSFTSPPSELSERAVFNLR
jgi:hypothetical protein